jgi:hemolysin activation/secretion protein
MIFLCCLGQTRAAWAGPGDSTGTIPKRVEVQTIDIDGNRRTKPAIIQRELPFSVGDTLAVGALEELRHTAQQTVYNTRLFQSVSVDYRIDAAHQHVRFHIAVEERWYWFLFPHFELVDRNFNEWWANQNRDFSRTEYGVKGYLENLRGRNEKLSVKAITGYNNRLELSYRIPFFKWEDKLGASIGFEHQTRREIQLRTRNNQQDFFGDVGGVLQWETQAKLDLSYRRNLFNRHHFSLGYRSVRVRDTVTTLNEDFFATQGSQQEFVDLRYSFTRDHRDVQAYPLEGSYLKASIRQMGIGVFNDVALTQVTLSRKDYLKLEKDLFLAGRYELSWLGPGEQPFSQPNGLGYDESFVRGYDLYVIDGQQYGLFKSALRWRAYSKEWRLDFMPLDQFKVMPVAFYPKAYFDAGYVRDHFDTGSGGLANSGLAGGGLGMDIVTFYDIVYRLEYSWNVRGENGLFVYFAVGI